MADFNLSNPVDHPVIRAFSSIIRKGAIEQLSSRALIRSIRAAGGAIRDSIAFAAIADLRERVRLESNLRFLNHNQAPNPARLPESLTPLRRQYSFRVGIGGSVVNGIPQFRQYVTVSSDTLLTRQDIEDIAADFPESNYDLGSLSAHNVQLLGGLRTIGGQTF